MLPGAQGRTAGKHHYWPGILEEKPLLGGTVYPKGLPRGHSGQRASPGPEDLPSLCLFCLFLPSPPSSLLLSLPSFFPSPPSHLSPFLFSTPLPFFPPFPSLLHPSLFLLPLPLFYFSSSYQILNSGQKVSLKPLFFPEFAESSQALSFPQFPLPNSPLPFLACNACLEGDSSGDTIPGP